jgi:hypothetical protein
VVEAEWWPEERTPAHQRFLWLEGIVLWQGLYPGLSVEPTALGRLIMVSFSYADIALPARFDLMFDKTEPAKSSPCESVIVGVTQQFGKPFDHIPSGWRTLAVIEFPQGIPEPVRELPIVKSWDYLSTRVAICHQADYFAIREYLQGPGAA